VNEVVNYKLDRVLEILTTNVKVDHDDLEVCEENVDITDFVMPDLPKTTVEEVLDLNKHLESIVIRNRIVSIPHTNFSWLFFGFFLGSIVRFLNKQKRTQKVRLEHEKSAALLLCEKLYFCGVKSAIL
jgi:hypothetical protein